MSLVHTPVSFLHTSQIYTHVKKTYGKSVSLNFPAGYHYHLNLHNYDGYSTRQIIYFSLIRMHSNSFYFQII